MLEIEDYREIVLEIILSGKYVSRPVCELRLSLFIQAANNYFQNEYVSCLEPFPSCFFDPSTQLRLYDNLKEHILNISKLTKSNFTQNTSLPALTWQLLHWVITNPLDITAITESEISNYLTEELRERTKLQAIPYPNKECIVFKISPSVPKAKFIELKIQFGSFYAFHGSPSQNFHSIIHRGLISALNKVSAHGFGTYLTSDLETAKLYSRKHYLTNQYFTTKKGNLWNLAGRHYCVAIVEVVRHPSIKVVDFDNGYQTNSTSSIENNVNHVAPIFDSVLNKIKYYIVANDELMQLRNLLVFDGNKI